MKVIEQYKLDPDLFSDADIKRGRILLNADAKQYRDRLMKQQQDFLLPAPPEKQPDSSVQQQDQEAIQAFERYKQQVTDSSFAKDIVTHKRLSIGEGDDQFHFGVEEPERLLNVLFDNNEWQKAIFNEDGSPNTRKQLLLAAVAYDDEGLLKELGKHYKALGAREAIAPLENASGKDATPARSEGEVDIVKALATKGRITSS